MKRIAIIILAAFAAFALPAGATSRIKDVATLQSARDNQLVGYGLVIGLQGSGDSLRNSPFTEQSIRAMLENLGIASQGSAARSRNVAAVIVTANLPAFVQSGARIDVNVSSMGDAASLQGGTLVMTPLRAPDGDIYAVAQGGVIVSGFTAQGAAETLTQGVPTAGRVPNGAIVQLSDDGELCIFTSATSHLLLDVAGYVPDGTDSLSTIPAARLFDSRAGLPLVDGTADGPRIPGGEFREIQVTGRAGVPDDASAALLNVGIVFPDGPGFVTLWPCGPMPTTSNLNHALGGGVRANNAVTKLSADGKVCVYTLSGADLILDITGWLE